jgi:L-lysine 2,3-aminomutase
VPGLLHKYQGRALLVTTGACAVHCRYCFRREYDYEASRNRGLAPLAIAISHIAADASIREVILSGGDPLSLSDARLAHALLRARATSRMCGACASTRACRSCCRNASTPASCVR